MLHIYLAYVDADQTDIHLKIKIQRSLGVKKAIVFLHTKFSTYNSGI